MNIRRLSVALSLTLALCFSAAFAQSLAASLITANVQKDKEKKKDKGKKNEEREPTQEFGKELSKKSSKEAKADKKSKSTAPTSAPTATGAPALWEDRGDITKLDLYWGIGGVAGEPKAPFKFDKEDTTGTNPKIKVVDANNVKWNIKFDEEVHAEVACSRIVWACGYMVEESYFVPAGKVAGVKKLGRAAKFVRSDGSFVDAMFEKRPDNVARRAINWDWTSNPFAGSKELAGLEVLAFLLSNWDAKVTNNNVLGMFDANGGVKDWYLVADWGGTFGKTGGFTSHSKWSLSDYSKQQFIDSAAGGAVKFHYSGKMGGSTSIPKESVRWFNGLIGQLTDAQIGDAFRAAGATQAEAAGFTTQLRRRITQLKSAAGR